MDATSTIGIAQPVTARSWKVPLTGRNKAQTADFRPLPHDETGHTWHHGHAMLFAYTSRGGQAYLDRGVTFNSGMRAQDMLSASVTTLVPSYSDGESSIDVPSYGCDWHRRVQLMN